MDFQPDIIIDTYYFFSFLENPKIKIVKLVTDLFSPAKACFFGTKNTEYIVFSEQAKEFGGQITNSKIYLTAPLIWLDHQKIETKKVTQKNPKLLVLGGGDSFLNGEKILQNLTTLDPKIEVTVVCGRNQNLPQKAQELKSKNELQNWTVFGFSTEVPKLIHDSDLVITKAGPATIWEILTLKRPMILTSFIWKQELGNKDFVVDQNLGIYEPNPEKLKPLIEHFFTNPKKYSLLLDNLQKLNLPKQNSDLGKHLLNL